MYQASQQREMTTSQSCLRMIHRMLGEVTRLFTYLHWLPVEIHQISFYLNKIISLSEVFQSFTITDTVYLIELLTDTTLNLLITDILDYKNEREDEEDISFRNYNQPPDLNLVGDRLVLELALIYHVPLLEFGKPTQNFAFKYFYYDPRTFQEPKEDVFVGFPDSTGSNFLQSVSTSSGKSKMDILFDILFSEVNRLLTYPEWLPVERCQISFYSQQLRFYSKFFKSFAITYEESLSVLLNGKKLNTLVTKILEYKNTSVSVDFLNFNDPPGLTLVGDQLALEVALIHKTSMLDFDRASQHYGSQFYFDKKKFQEYEGEVFVGFQVEASNLLKQLASITKKKLQVITIVGMAGLGKTTLTRRLYNDPYVVSYFYVRAWITCSQVYQKRDLLLSIIKSVTEITDDVCKMSDNLLAHHLYRALKGRKYLIVIDDIWSNEAWDDFKASFPNDNNGSKIMLTTRLKDVALHAQTEGTPLCLRFLTEEESFDLFRRKAFITGSFFDDLSLIGMSITRKCRGLPLAIVVIAGLLKNSFDIGWWTQVAESVSSYIGTDENQYRETLALSYNHLPQHLRPCFLSFGAFSEDYEIPVHKLIWFWIAEGFVHQNGTKKRLEEVSEDYLQDLIRRSLVVGNKGSDGAIKTCRIHDLLRDLCLRKAEEENFLPKIYRYNRHSYSCSHSSTYPSEKSQLLLSANVINIPSNCSCYCSEVSQSFFKEVSIIWDTSKLITALDISSIELSVFPSELLQMVHLKYLELRFRSGNPPEFISDLRELQTLIMSSRMNMFVPNNMWNMINLRHLFIKSGENHVISTNVGQVGILENMQTMSLVSPTRSCQRILARTPNLKKLGLCGPLTTKSGDVKFPDLGHLVHLEILKLLNTIPLCKAGRLSDSIMFPECLKSLSLSNTYLDWNEAWAFEMIPNLQVLKLKFHAFVGKEWETNPGAFPRLKFLKLDELGFATWKASRNNFPVLQRLQVYQCPYLMEIPKDFGNICTLDLIELRGCSDAAANSAKDIKKDQENNGNDWLKILLTPGYLKSCSKDQENDGNDGLFSQ